MSNVKVIEVYRIFLKIFYDGTGYYGSQRQPGLRTVEGVFLKALSGFQAAPVEVHFSGRTDRSVHSIGQTVAITFKDRVDEEKLVQRLNEGLPPDTSVWAFRSVNFEWHPRYSPTARSYLYVDDCQDVNCLEEVLSIFRGTHDFSCFSIAEHWQDPWRTIKSIKVYRACGFSVYEFCGDSFMRQMIRRIVSVAKLAAMGKIGLEEVMRALRGGGCGRLRAVRPAPPWRLVLLNVWYPFAFIKHVDGAARVREYLKSARMGGLSELIYQVFSSRIYELL